MNATIHTRIDLNIGLVYKGIMNIKYDPNYISFDDHLNLQIFFFKDVEAIRAPNECIARLYKKGLVEPSGLYHFKISNLGRFALRNVRKKERVVIDDSFRLPHMVGKKGKVLRFVHANVDSDGHDEFGYQIRFHKPFCYAVVKLDDFPHAEWCFYKATDLRSPR